MFCMQCHFFKIKTDYFPPILNQSAILAWDVVKEGLASSNIQVNHEAWIESVKNPPAPAEVGKALPW